MHPVVAVYATFLNRAFDQVLLDVAMHRLPVTFVLDRAGITGPDGPSHYGIWDMSVFGVVPGLRIAAPRDAATLREELREAVAIDDGPTIVRFPTGSVPADLPALRRRRRRSTCWPRASDATCCWSRSARSPTWASTSPAGCAEHGYGVTVVDPRWVRPVPVELVGLAARAPAGRRRRGRRPYRRRRRRAGEGLRDAGVRTPLRDLGVEPGWHPHGTRAEILADLGLTVDDVTRDVLAMLSDVDVDSVAQGG